MSVLTVDLAATLDDDGAPETWYFDGAPFSAIGAPDTIDEVTVTVDRGALDPSPDYAVAVIAFPYAGTITVSPPVDHFVVDYHDCYVGLDSGGSPTGLGGAPVTVSYVPDDPANLADNLSAGVGVACFTVDGSLTPVGPVGVTLAVGEATITYTGGGGGGGGPEAPAEVPSPISVEVWDASNASKVADLDGSFDRSWQDQANEPGSASVSISSDADAADELVVGRHLRFFYGDDLAFTSLIGEGDIRRTLAGSGDQTAQITVVSSPGHVAEWDLATVLPVNGVGGMPAGDRRSYSWASPEMDVSGWNAAFTYLGQISRQINLDPPHHEPWFPPKGWPYPLSAEWMWTMNRGVTFPPGIGLFAKDFELESDTLVSHFIAGDGRARLYVDGMIAHDWTESWPTQSFLSTYWAPIQMSAGVHRLALEVEVYDGLLALEEARPPRGMVTWCAHAETGTGAYLPGTALGASVASEWRAFDVVSAGGVVPAPTPHQIVASFVAEAQADDMLDGWTLSSTATTDSAGVAWETPVPITVTVGSSGLDLLKALAAVSIDWWAQPAGKVLHLFNRGGRGVEVADAAIEAGTNAYELVRTA